ncbi:MAG: hypothetical protein NT027_13035, partial [Proteobacteria bacterium]|nr:hypothetical protein [Pseudomonadota bacterium]
FAILLIIHNGVTYLPMFQFGGSVGNTDLQNCIIRSQRYLYDLKNPNLVFIGSSLTARIRTKLLPGSVFNLAYPCLSGMTGLSIVEKKTEAPKVLVIQLNQMLNLDPLLIDDVLSPASYIPKKYLRALRQEFRPTSILRFIFGSLTGSKGQLDDWYLPQKIDLSSGEPLRLSQESIAQTYVDAQSMPKVNYDISKEVRSSLEQNVREQYELFFLKDGTSYIDTPLFSKRVTEFRQKLMDLKSKGTRVYFNQMPLDRANENFEIYVHYVKRIRDMFANETFIYVQSEDFSYTDGLHLDDRSAVLYTKELSKQLNLDQ